MTPVLKNLRNLILDSPITYPWIKSSALVPLKSATSWQDARAHFLGSLSNKKHHSRDKPGHEEFRFGNDAAYQCTTGFLTLFDSGFGA
jgi:hypothetical protein